MSGDQGASTQPAVLWLGEKPDLSGLDRHGLGELDILHADWDGYEEALAALAQPPLVVVLGPDAPEPLTVARLIYRRSPLSYLVFVLDTAAIRDLRESMALTPMIGTSWSIVDLAAEPVTDRIAAAVTASRQRRFLRTSLDAINVHVGAEKAPQDSSEYKRLVISDRFLATILEHAHDAIISLDLTRRVLTWNRGAGVLFGYDPAQAQRLRVEDLVADADREALLVAFDEARRGDSAHELELRLRRASGTVFTGEATLAPVREEKGEIVAVSLTIRDISERKRNEERLRQLHSELEERVVERTAALRAVNRELESFTYSASHDLRAPLRGIDGFSQALLEDYGELLDDRARDYVRRVRSGAKKMGQIIDALLMLSRISRTDMEPEPVDLREIAQATLEEFRTQDPDRQVEFRCDENMVVQADHQLMQIALYNLLHNAWKFTRDREEAVIEFRRLEDAAAHTFFVRDNGAGFDMAFADKLFVPFQRLHDVREFEGSGIGLGTVHRIINRHGGRLWAQGKEGEGATFYFELPPDVRSISVGASTSDSDEPGLRPGASSGSEL